MDGLAEVLLFVAIVLVVGVAGIRLGMLIAPRLDVMSEPHDEEAGGHDD
jgi:hypothetical protein